MLGERRKKPPRLKGGGRPAHYQPVLPYSVQDLMAQGPLFLGLRFVRKIRGNLCLSCFYYFLPSLSFNKEYLQLRSTPQKAKRNRVYINYLIWRTTSSCFDVMWRVTRLFNFDSTTLGAREWGLSFLQVSRTRYHFQ